MRVPHWTHPLTQKALSLFIIPPDTRRKLAQKRTWEAASYIAESFLTAMRSSPELAKTFGSVHLMGAAHSYAIMSVFGLQKQLHIYKIASEFGSVLKRVTSKVAADYLPFDNVIRCIEFPDGISFDMRDGDTAHSCYIMACKPDHPEKTTVEYKRIIDLTAPLYNKSGMPIAQDNLRILLTDDDTLESAIERALDRTDSLNPTGFTAEFVQYILKCLLYINSGDPDLREFKPAPKPKNAKAIKRWRRENLATVPIILVGFDYKKPRQFASGESFVNTHERWQPYGPGKSLVKLIWVKEHTRHYKKESTEAQVFQN